MALAKGFGLLFDSLVPIHGAIPVEGVIGDGPVISISWSQRDASQPSELLYEHIDEGLIFSPPGIGQFRIRCDAIDVQMLPEANPDHAHMLLIATALPALLWLRGAFMLHATAVLADGDQGAIAITGPSGSGKSTIAHALVEQGAKLVADDSICIRADQGDIWGSGLAGGLFIRNGDDRHFQSLSPARSIAEAPLSCIVVLEDADAPPAMVPLCGVEATQSLLLHRHRPAVPALLRLSADGIKFTTHLASSVPVLAWHKRDHGRDFDPDQFLHDIASALDGDRQ
jgi:hypothetical protein